MNTAEYLTSLITTRVVELAGIGALWSLVHGRRILLAASPKADPQPQQSREAKAAPDTGTATPPVLLPGSKASDAA